MRAIVVLALIGWISVSHAGVARREVTRDGVVFIEETHSYQDGRSSKLVYPKPGQEKAVPRTTMPPAGGGARILPAATASEIAAAVGECSPMQSSFADPQLSGESVRVEVHGLRGGRCKMTQTMPGRRLQTCVFNEADRKEIREKGRDALQVLMQDPEICTIQGA